MPCRLFVFRYIFAWPILKLFVQFLRGSPNMQIGLTIFMFKGPMRFHFALYIYIYKKKKEKKKRRLFFSLITWFLISPTYHGSIFIAFVYVHHTHLLST